MKLQRAYHRAHLIDSNGHCSALCYQRPRLIDLRKALWTIRDEAVTCRKCLNKIAERQTREGR